MQKHTLFALVFFLASLVFFVLGLLYPVMSSDIMMGWVQEKQVYLIDSVRLLWDKGELFLGWLILLFSIVFPILKYIVVGLKVLHVPYPGHQRIGALLDVINKWAMLDVFVVALIIINMKTGHSLVFSMNVEVGLNYFAASIVLLMLCNWILKRRIISAQIREAAASDSAPDISSADSDSKPVLETPVD